MPRSSSPRSCPRFAPLLLLSAAHPLLRAQAPIGSVEVSAATVSGAISISDGKALVGSNAIVTARDRTADLQLARGGEIEVCTTSALHAARSPGPNEPAPLLLALDRGAIEVHMITTSRDTILTPDLRISLPSPGPGLPAAGLLDLRLRVTSNGDTCVDNRGSKAPALEVAELFGSGLYLVRPGQHLLFEHGSLREVVDHETSPCGCPAPPALSVASNGISTDVTRAAVPKARVADDPDEVKPHTDAALEYPFPAAESQGLTPSQNISPNPEPSTPGQPHAQVAATLAFNPGTATPAISSSTPARGSAPSAAAGTPRPNAAVPAAATPQASGTTAATPPAATPLATAPPATASVQPAPSSIPPAISSTAPSPVQSASAAAPTPSRPPQPTPRQEPPASANPSPNTDSYTSHEVAQAPLPAAAPGAHSIAHSFSHFFRHLFGRDSHPRPTAAAASTPPAS